MINIYCSLFIAIAIVPERELARSFSIIKLSKRMRRMREYDVGLCGLFTFYILHKVVILSIITIRSFFSLLFSFTSKSVHSIKWTCFFSNRPWLVLFG